MNNDELEQLKQRVIELTRRLEHMECRAWEMTKLAFNNVQPALALTDAEREAVEWFAEVNKPLARLTKSNRREQYIATLRGLLERMK